MGKSASGMLGVIMMAATVAVAGSASAHHSYAAFDRTKTVTVNGTVETVEWTNPHIWVFVQAPGADGKMTRYAIEGDAPGGMVRIGWKKSSAKPGDKISVTINPMITGQTGGHYVTAVLPGNVRVGRGQEIAPQAAN